MENKERDMKKLMANARVVAAILKSNDWSHKKVTTRIGCGSTLLSMYTGKEYFRPASPLTELVVERLTELTPAVMSDNRMRAAMDAFPSAKSIIERVGEDKVASLTGVTPGTVKRWKKNITDLWTPLRKPRIAVAALRLLALDYSADVAEEGPDLFDLSTLSGPELDRRAEEEERVKDTAARTAKEFIRGSNSRYPQDELAKKLAALSDLVDTVFMDFKTRKEVAMVISRLTDTVKGAAKVRQKEIQEELAKMRALGV